jgi:hypothetical protein
MIPPSSSVATALTAEGVVPSWVAWDRFTPFFPFIGPVRLLYTTNGIVP